MQCSVISPICHKCFCYFFVAYRYLHFRTCVCTFDVARRSVICQAYHLLYTLLGISRFYNIFTHKVCIKIIWAIKISTFVRDKYIQYLLIFGTKPKANLIRRSFVFFPFFSRDSIIRDRPSIFYLVSPHTLPISFTFIPALSNIEFSRRTRENGCPLLSRAAANLMTPRIIVRLLTGEKWPFTCGRI